MFRRSSGILMHITSLPNPYGVGTFGKEAYDFVDFLKNPVRVIGNYCRLDPRAMGNHPTNRPQLLQVIFYSLILKY